MNDPRRSPFGGICAILLGISYVALAAAHLLVPAQQQGSSASAQFFMSFAVDALPIMLQYGIAALGAILAFGAIPAITALVSREHEKDVVRWATTLAYIGFAAVLFDSVRFLAYEPARASLFMAGDSSIRTSILVSDPMLYLDAQGWFGFGGVGIWVLIVSISGLRHRSLPRTLAWTGCGVAAAYWLVLAGFVLNSELLFTAAAVAGSIVGPIWFVGAGLRLMRSGIHSSASSSTQTLVASGTAAAN